MRSSWDSPLALLLLTGGLLGLSLPLGKIATVAGVSAAVWSVVISSGAGGTLLAYLILRRRPAAIDAHFLRYSVIAAAISYAAPNLLLFSVVPRLGAAYAGLMLTLSPVFTLAISLMLRLRAPSALGFAGIATGFVGAAIVALSRAQFEQSAGPLWIAAGLLVPVFLASGNVYRTLDWPVGAGPIELAAGSHLAAALMLLAGVAATDRLEEFAMLSRVPLVTAGQMASAALMFVLFFRLQRLGGPVYLSQIGYVAAGVGLVSGTLLGESYSIITWAGAGVIAIGVAMTTRAQMAGAQA